MLIEPRQIPLHAIEQQRRFFDAVRRARIDNHLGRAPLLLQRVIELQPLR